MNSIDLLEHGGGQQFGFVLRHKGVRIPVADPRTKHYQWVLMALSLQHVPVPEDMPEWQRRLVFDRWAAAWDLPDFQQARRLAYLVDHYRAALAYDLSVYTQEDLGELWRERRWRHLLDIIDRLPSHSWYNASVQNDEEHAKMVAEAMAARKPDEKDDRGPSVTTWTPEVAVMHNVLDAVRRVEHAIFAAQMGKKAGSPPPPVPRPVTALERAMRRAEFDRRKKSHESLVARVLPNKARVKAPSQPLIH